MGLRQHGWFSCRRIVICDLGETALELQYPLRAQWGELVRGTPSGHRVLRGICPVRFSQPHHVLRRRPRIVGFGSFYLVCR